MVDAGIKVAAYLRVSTTDQNTDIQRNDLERYCKARGWRHLRFYEDKASGTSTNSRMAFKELLTSVRERGVDIVIVWKLDRFFRSLKDMVLTLQELSDLGVQFISLKDQLDLTTSTGRLMTHILGAFAEFEASLIRERVKAGLVNARRKGRRLGRPKRRDDGAIQSLRSRGFSIRGIAKQLQVSPSAVQRAIAVSKTPENLVEIPQ